MAGFIGWGQIMSSIQPLDPCAISMKVCIETLCRESRDGATWISWEDYAVELLVLDNYDRVLSGQRPLNDRQIAKTVSKSLDDLTRPFGKLTYIRNTTIWGSPETLKAATTLRWSPQEQQVAARRFVARQFVNKNKSNCRPPDEPPTSNPLFVASLNSESVAAIEAALLEEKEFRLGDAAAWAIAGVFMVLASLSPVRWLPETAFPGASITTDPPWGFSRDRML